jgi:hypothetical protein
MSDKLDAYLEEISHFLSVKAEREEILADIRGHILEKAAEGSGPGAGAPGGVPVEAADAALERAIADFGPARRAAERYLDESRPIIAPAYRRYLFRYTTLLFAFHALLTAAAVIFKQDFVLFPFIYMPRLNVLSALMYLPTAFLTDLGVVTLVLYFITQSGKDVRLPWPRFGVDLDEVKPPSAKVLVERIFIGIAAVVMLAVTDFALLVFARRGTIFFVNLDWRSARSLFTPGAGRRVSLIVIAMLAASTLALLAKVITSSRWVEAVSSLVWLALLGLLLTQPFDNLFAVRIAPDLLPKVRFGVTFALLFIAAFITIDLIKDIVVLSRRRLNSVTHN